MNRDIATHAKNCQCADCLAYEQVFGKREADPISPELRETQMILDTLRTLYKERRTIRSVLAQTEEQIKRHQQQVHQSLMVMPQAVLEVLEADMKVQIEQKDLNLDFFEKRSKT